jgi:hypothetical protein
MPSSSIACGLLGSVVAETCTGYQWDCHWKPSSRSGGAWLLVGLLLYDVLSVLLPFTDASWTVVVLLGLE